MHLRRAIERYLAEGLPAKEERRLREHLSGCEACRRIYDEEVLLRRALAGAPTQPTRAEEERLHRLVVERAGLLTPPARTPRRSFAARVRSTPWYFAPMGTAALALIVGLWLLHPWRGVPVPVHSVPKPVPAALMESVLAARLLQARSVTIGGLPAEAGALIRTGTAVVVTAEGIAELELARGGRVRLFPRTQLAFSQRGETIELTDGKVWCEIEAARGQFVVRTERGEARVLGTSFVVEELPSGDSEVRVLSGVVEVQDTGHRRTVRVKDGQRTRLMSGEPPAQVRSYDPQTDRADWEQTFRKVGREIERTFRKLGNKLRLP